MCLILVLILKTQTKDLISLLINNERSTILVIKKSYIKYNYTLNL